MKGLEKVGKRINEIHAREKKSERTGERERERNTRINSSRICTKDHKSY